MNKIFTLSLLVGFLVLMNLAMMAFLIMDKKPHHKEHYTEAKADMHIKKTFGFDEDQMRSFKMSKEKHISKMSQFSRKLNEESRKYYEVSSTETSKKDSLLNVVIELSEEIYKSNNQHFDEVRAVCNPHQLPQLDNFIQRLIEGNKGPKNRGPRNHH